MCVGKFLRLETDKGEWESQGVERHPTSPLLYLHLRPTVDDYIVLLPRMSTLRRSSVLNPDSSRPPLRVYPGPILHHGLH